MVEYIAKVEAAEREPVMVRFTVTPRGGEYQVEALGLARWTTAKLPTRPGLIKTAKRIIAEV